MSDLRVLHVAGLLDPAYGGPSVVAVELCDALYELGLDVELVATDRGFGSRARYLLPAGERAFTIRQFPVHWPTGYNTSWRMAIYLCKAVREADVVHIHSIYGFHTLVAALVARARRVPYIIEPHGALTRYHHRQKRSKKALHERLIDLPILRHSAAIRCASRAEAQDLRWLRLHALASVVPHGVNPPLPRERDAHLIAQESPTILFLGRLTQKKRIDLTIRAFAIVRESVPSARLRLVGPADASICVDARALVSSLDLDDVVDFVGPVYGESRWFELRSAAVFVLLSEDESYGLAALEAASVGTPVVATEGVAAASDLHCHVSVCSPDPVAAAHAITAVLQSHQTEGTREYFAAQVFTTYAWTSIAQRVRDMYERAARSHRAMSRTRRPR